jgi:hypothetical protein
VLPASGIADAEVAAEARLANAFVDGVSAPAKRLGELSMGA